ncbi:MAG: NAD(P)H-dependent glycerol-3-phosphate dehydrogenase, partial [Candidatus Margulisiibacteriota bacterium]
MAKIAVIGAGAWGTTLSILLAENQHGVTLWVYEKELISEILQLRENKKYLPGVFLPNSITITNKINETKNNEVYFFVIPTQFLRSVAKKFAKVISESSILVSASKGIEENTLKLPSDILAEEIGNRNLCILSGPNLSLEIAKGLPAATVVASQNEELAKTIQGYLSSQRFR